MTKNVAALDPWPDLPLEAWKDTYATLHMWTQMVGKTCLALAPPQNHWWHIALRVTARGRGARSEEHTSELQSHVNLVCRLLLEKKKQRRKNTPNENIPR